MKPHVNQNEDSSTITTQTHEYLLHALWTKRLFDKQVFMIALGLLMIFTFSRKTYCLARSPWQQHGFIIASQIQTKFLIFLFILLSQTLQTSHHGSCSTCKALNLIVDQCLQWIGFTQNNQCNVQEAGFDTLSDFIDGNDMAASFPNEH